MVILAYILTFQLHFISLRQFISWLLLSYFVVFVSQTSTLKLEVVYISVHDHFQFDL